MGISASQPAGRPDPSRSPDNQQARRSALDPSRAQGEKTKPVSQQTSRPNPAQNGFQKAVDWVAHAIGLKGPDNSPYENFSGRTIKVSEIKSEAERK